MRSSQSSSLRHGKCLYCVRFVPGTQQILLTVQLHVAGKALRLACSPVVGETREGAAGFLRCPPGPPGSEVTREGGARFRPRSGRARGRIVVSPPDASPSAPGALLQAPARPCPRAAGLSHASRPPRKRRTLRSQSPRLGGGGAPGLQQVPIRAGRC